MASELLSLISRLKMYQPIGTNTRPHALGFIVDYKRFISTLENIKEMIGLESAKRQIAHQVESFIVNYRRYNTPTNGQKLHTLLCGPPGCGKTQLGRYLAELWATSGCLSQDTKNVQLFAYRPEQANGPKQLTFQNSTDSEKVTLRQTLAIREAQLRQFQQKIQTTNIAVNDVLTQFNNVRKKVHSKSPDHEQRIQAKFQEIKKKLRDVTEQRASERAASVLLTESSSSSKPSAPEILPVTIPKVPGVRSTFGTSTPPLLPHLPNLIDPNTILAQLPSIEKHEPVKPLAKFTRLTKGDLIGKYQGHTNDQVRKILQEHIGGVVMIDEAYNLCTSGQDDFGKEILTEIIDFMTTWPDKIIFIFAGYRKEMEETILKFQPGLARRFKLNFDIEAYTAQELNLIFQQQLKKHELTLTQETLTQLDKFFTDNVEKFPHFGGDTERFCDFVDETFNQRHWLAALDDNMSSDDYNKLFTSLGLDCITESFQKYLQHSVKEKEEDRKKKDEESKKKEAEESFEKVRHIYG